MRIVTAFGDIEIKKGHSYYWIANGKVPAEVAEKLYNHAIGRPDVRVAGHCGCPAPKKWVEWFDSNGVRLANNDELKPYLNEDGSRKNPESIIWLSLDDPKYKWVDDPSKEGKGFITLYHIDTVEGLLFFVVTLMTELNAKVVF